MNAVDFNWKRVSAAWIPLAGLRRLAMLRHRGDISVLRIGENAWIRWPVGDPEVIRSLLPVPGVQFFRREKDGWFPFGSRLPAASPPPDDVGQPLANVLLPERFEILSPHQHQLAPVPLRIVRGGDPTTATGLICHVDSLVMLANSATTAELARIMAARSRERAVLLGTVLPNIPGATRLYGDSLLIPVGFRVEPRLPVSAIRDAAGADAGEILVWLEAGLERIPKAAFESLTRAGIRLAHVSEVAK